MLVKRAEKSARFPLSLLLPRHFGLPHLLIAVATAKRIAIQARGQPLDISAHRQISEEHFSLTFSDIVWMLLPAEQIYAPKPCH